MGEGKKFLNYAGYYGEYEYNTEKELWEGRLIYIDDCIDIKFKAKDRVSLNKAFREAVEKYIIFKSNSKPENDETDKIAK